MDTESDRASASRGASAVATSIVFVAIAGSIVAVRFIARAGLVRRCGADDALIVLALALSVALTILIHAQQEHGLGRHFNTLSAKEFEDMLKPFHASVVVYNLGLTMTKCSILCQYLRFFVDSAARRVCYAFLGVVVAYGIANLCGAIFACTPIAYFWNKNIQGGHCINLMVFWFCNATFNIISDIGVCILPIPVLKSLQLPRKQKYGLLLVFVLGGFGCVTSILRLHSLYVISRSTDVTWDNVGAATWSSVELNVGITCACLPTLKPVLTLVFPRLLLSSSRRRHTVELRGEPYVQRGTNRDIGTESKSTAGQIHESREVHVEHGSDDGLTASFPIDGKYAWSIRGH